MGRRGQKGTRPVERGMLRYMIFAARSAVFSLQMPKRACRSLVDGASARLGCGVRVELVTLKLLRSFSTAATVPDSVATWQKSLRQFNYAKAATKKFTEESNSTLEITVDCL